MAHHERVVYSCQCLAYACRCTGASKTTRTLPYPCPQHQAQPVSPPAKEPTHA